MVGGLHGSNVNTNKGVESSKEGVAYTKNIASTASTNNNKNLAQILHKSNKQKDLSTTMTNSHYQNGGASSAWRSSVYSRGPVNYPNNGWYNGEKQFKQFTKTGQYISNTELPYAAAPISTGAVKDDNPIQGTVSDYLSQYAAYGSGKKKKTPTKKKTSTKKKKTPTKKKKLSTKKKKTPTKKKKTPTKKKKTSTKKKKTPTKKKKTKTKKKKT